MARSSHRRYPYAIKKGVLKNYAKSIGKHLRETVAGWRPSNLLNKRLWHRCFSMSFAKTLLTPFYRSPPGDCFWILTSYQL